MTVQLEPDVQEKLTRYLTETGEPCDRAVNAALREFFEDLDDYHDVLANRAAGGATISAEDLRRELGLDR